MNQENLAIHRYRALGSISNDLGSSLPAIIRGFGIPAVRDAAQLAFARGRSAISGWCTVEEPGPPRHLGGMIDGLLPLPCDENAALEEARRYADEVMPRSAIIGLSWSLSDQRAAILTIAGLAAQGREIGAAIAASAEEAVVDALEGATFDSSQVEAAALSATSLTSAIAKAQALRGPGGGLVPQVSNLLISPDVAPTVNSVWPGGIAGLSVRVSRMMPAARWYLVPAADEGVLRYDISERLAVRDVNASPAAEAALAISAAVSENPLILTAANGSPRGLIKGGI